MLVFVHGRLAVTRVQISIEWFRSFYYYATMKKKCLFLLATFIVAMTSVGFVSCGSDDDDNSPSNGLVGTKWTITYGEKYILEFTSANQYSFYESDVNNNYVDNLQTGSFSYSDNKIKFTDIFSLSKTFSFEFYYAREATISGNVMTVIANGEKLNFSTGETTNLGDKTFTFMKIP